MLIKTNFHLHTADDPRDRLSYSIFEAVDEAARLGFGALALTCHKKFIYNKEYFDYAAEKSILLIFGIEANIEGKDVLILSCNKEIEKIKTLSELREYKENNPQIFVIAPHPFVWDYSMISLGKKLIKNIDIFDAIELTIFNNIIFNFNKKATKIAKKYNKPLVATSDTHRLKDFERGYIVVEVKNKTPEAIFGAIKRGDFENKIISMSLWGMADFRIGGILRKIFNRARKSLSKSKIISK